MSSSNLTEVRAYCRGRKETERVMHQITDSGLPKNAINVSGKEGYWGKGPKARQMSIVKSAVIGLPIGAVVGGIIGVITQTSHAAAAGFHINWLIMIGFIVLMALFCGGVAAILAAGLGKLAPSPGNEPASSGRYLITVRCRSEDKLKIQSLLVGQGAILTDKQGSQNSEARSEKVRGLP